MCFAKVTQLTKFAENAYVNVFACSMSVSIQTRPDSIVFVLEYTCNLVHAKYFKKKRGGFSKAVRVYSNHRNIPINT